MSTQDELNLEPLADTYHIVGETAAHEDDRAYIGRRKRDGADVLIRVVRSPADDAKNALTLFAADARVLTGITQRNVVPVLDACWLGAEALAVITERVSTPTLEEVLARGEQFSCERVASILREIHAVLVWAREQKLVHRIALPDTVYLEPATDRVLVSFAMRPIPVTSAADGDDDARTIGALAWAMLARTADPLATDAPPLAELRPDLAKRLTEATDALHRSARGAESAPDVREYIALVAMADALRTGEEEEARTQEAIAEEQRAVRDELALERAQVAAEREKLEREAAADREQREHEREEAQREIAEQREQIAAEREAASAERERLSAERESLDWRHVQLDRQESELASFDAPAHSGAARDDVSIVGATAGGAPPQHAVPEVHEHDEDADGNADREPIPAPETPTVGVGRARIARWAVPGAALLIVGIIVATALGLDRSHWLAARRTAVYPMTSVFDSAGGRIVAPFGAAGRAAPPAAAARTITPASADSAREDSARIDSMSTAAVAANAAPPTPVRHRAATHATPAVLPSRPDTAAADTALSSAMAPQPVIVPPIAVPRAPSPTPDTTAKPDSTRSR